MRSFSLWIILMLVSFVFASGQSENVLKLHPYNPHYFLYQKKPLIIIGSGEHYGAVINLDFDFKKYIETLARDGLNTTRLFTGAYIEKLGDFGIAKNTLAPASGRLLLPWRRSNTPGYVLGGNKFDLSQWDEAYFERLKNFMQEASRNGVIVEATLFSAHYGGGWNYSAFNPKNNINNTDSVGSVLVNTLKNGNLLKEQEKYVRKLVNELNGYDNFYFEVQNEPWADQTDVVLQHNEYGSEKDWRSTLQVVSQASNDWQRKVAGWIKDEESRLPGKHLISQNISNFHYPIADADPAISIFNFHYALPQAVEENYYLNKAIGFNETGFAGSADKTYRRQAWRFLMAGGALFNQLDYSFSAGFENGQDTTYKAPGGGSPALRKQFAILKTFFESLNFVSLKPDPTLVKSSAGARAITLSNSKDVWIIYVEPMATRSHALLLNLPGAHEGQWMNVTTGQLQKKVTIINGRCEVPEDREDKVIVITTLPGKADKRK